jgi:competence protein ComEC
MFGRIPFTRYVFLLLAGIFGSSFYTPNQLTVWLVIVLLLGLAIASTGLTRGRNRSIGMLAMFSIVVIGWGSASLKNIRLQNAIEAIENKDYLAYQIRITSIPEKREKSIRYEARIENIFFPDFSEQVEADMIMHFNSDRIELPSIGQRLIIKGKLKRPASSNSELGFDYRTFLERKGIAWIGYSHDPANIWELPSSRQIVGAPGWAGWLSEKSDLVFRTYIHDDDAYGLVKAMVLGRRDDIREELNDAFIQSGTVHILSVSGLHIAIFFAGLHFVFGFLRNILYGRYVYLLLMISILTAYAIVTGMPASVQRATLMCIIWMLSTTYSRRHEPVNTLSIAGFFILLFDPNAIYDVGFQLSFLAMLGIFLWSRPLTALYRPGNRIANHFWKLSVMSVVAQIMTFPVVTYYFNQFPTYFLFANLLAVDIAGLLIPASFVLLLFGVSKIELVSNLAGYVVNYLAVLTNYIVQSPQKLPSHLLEHLYLDFWQTVLLLILIMIAYFLYTSRSSSLVNCLFFVSCFFGIYSTTTVLADFTRSFTITRPSMIIYKNTGRLYIVNTYKTTAFSQYDVRKYMARYGQDTLMIRVPLNKN